MARDVQKHIEFVRRIAELGIELGVTPADSMTLFGRITRGFIDAVDKKGDSGMTYDELVKNALDRFATGLGGMVANVSVQRMQEAPKEIH